MVSTECHAKLWITASFVPHYRLLWLPELLDFVLFCFILMKWEWDLTFSGLSVFIYMEFLAHPWGSCVLHRSHIYLLHTVTGIGLCHVLSRLEQRASKLREKLVLWPLCTTLSYCGGVAETRWGWVILPPKGRSPELSVVGDERGDEDHGLMRSNARVAP